MKIAVHAYAKLNLTLDVLGRAGEYHEIDSLAVTVDLSDKIIVKSRKDGKVTLKTISPSLSPEIPLLKNNAYLAALAYQKRFGYGAEILLYKNIPQKAGLGGSSADAAGILKALSMLYQTGEEGLKEIADSLGSDTGYLLSGGLARLKGRGEKIESLNLPLPVFFLLLLPEEGVSTKESFQRADILPKENFATEEVLKALQAGDMKRACKSFSNGLYPASKSLLPQIEKAYNSLLSLSPLGVSMTGSGSGVFAAFEHRELCEWAKGKIDGNFQKFVLRPKFF